LEAGDEVGGRIDGVLPAEVDEFDTAIAQALVAAVTVA
jgi:hypothetical protein